MNIKHLWKEIKCWLGFHVYVKLRKEDKIESCGWCLHSRRVNNER